MKTFLAAAAMTAALATGASAASVDINFEDLVADIGEQGVEGETFDFGGLSVTLTSTADAYLDGINGAGLPAGLGVCSTGLDGDDECNEPGDDNITEGETVTLTFSDVVTSVSNFVFRAANHEDISDTMNMVSLTGVASDDFVFMGDEEFINVATFLNSDGFGLNSISLSFAGTEFYLSSFTADVAPAPVPLPASVLLLGGALGGLGAMRRRKKAA